MVVVSCYSQQGTLLGCAAKSFTTMKTPKLMLEGEQQYDEKPKKFHQAKRDISKCQGCKKIKF